jgi:hypothetical protein
MHKEVWRYGSTKVVVTLGDDGMADIDVAGLVSLGSIASLRRDCVAIMCRSDIRAMVVDLRRSSVLLGACDVPLPALSMPQRVVAIPVAIVCSELDEPLFLSHAWHQAYAGLTRAVFTDRDEALSWARARADGTSALGALS